MTRRKLSLRSGVVVATLLAWMVAGASATAGPEDRATGAGTEDHVTVSKLDARPTGNSTASDHDIDGAPPPEINRTRVSRLVREGFYENFPITGPDRRFAGCTLAAHGSYAFEETARCVAWQWERFPQRADCLSSDGATYQIEEAYRWLPDFESDGSIQWTRSMSEGTTADDYFFEIAKRTTERPELALALIDHPCIMIEDLAVFIVLRSRVPGRVESPEYAAIMERMTPERWRRIVEATQILRDDSGPIWLFRFVGAHATSKDDITDLVWHVANHAPDRLNARALAFSMLREQYDFPAIFDDLERGVTGSRLEELREFRAQCLNAKLVVCGN